MKKLLLAIIYVCFSVAPALAAPTEQCELHENSFAHKVGRPVSLSFYQPTPNLSQKVFDLDHNGYLQPFAWQAFYNSDVLVYFFLNEADMGYLHPKVQRALRLHTDPINSQVEIRHLDLEDGGEKLAIFFLLEGLSEEKFDLLLERIEYLVYWAITQDFNEDFLKYLAVCWT